MPSKIIENNFRVNRLPHIWCPGCGHGILMHSIAMAIEELNLDKDKVCIVSGIGCSSRSSGYLNYNTVHTTHGRALSFATGIKLADPSLHVIVITGDGDCTAIGGNHLIHSCRRNIDITTIVFNNDTYGMTGGQYSPTTNTGDKATTAPYGNIDRPFDICDLSAAAGATFVARGSVYHVNQMLKYTKSAIAHKGFSVVEGLSVCPTYYGRKNKKGSAIELINEIKANTIISNDLTASKEKNKIAIGIFKDIQQPEYTEEYKKIMERF
ncbi:MAG: 2-oxoacid:ferredoxin oxidoreductase subunit beta [Romboutsia sp.]